MTAARRLARFRAALVVFVFTTVLMLFIGLPIIWRAANLQNLADPATPTPVATFTAVGILLAWWGSFVAVWVANANLRTYPSTSAR
jgi:hypothetical protein